MASGWRVVGQRGVEQFQPNGQFEQGMEVQIKTDSGTYKTFFIPQGMYTAENVKAVIEAWYEHEQAVNNL